MIIAAFNDEKNNNQMDLFNFSHGLYGNRPKKKKKLCLKCGKVELTQTYSIKDGCYVGNRMCNACKAMDSTKFGSEYSVGW